MYLTEERVRLVKQRVSTLQRRQENNWFGVLGTLGIAFSVALVTAITAVTDTTGVGMMPGLSGSILRFNGAGGYVLLELLVLIAAVVVTVLCIRYKDKQKQNKE